MFSVNVSRTTKSKLLIFFAICMNLGIPGVQKWFEMSHVLWLPDQPLTPGEKDISPEELWLNMVIDKHLKWL